MREYRGKKVLVTGGTGFIGSRLAERLTLEEEADVTVLVHNWSRATWVSRSDVRLVQGNILQGCDLDTAVDGCEIVFHCVGVGGTLDQCMKTNVEGTKMVLERCLKNGVKRIVYLSSSVVHGPEISEGMNERAPFIKTGDPYADSKIEAEEYFNTFIARNEIEGSIVRPTFVWGPASPYYTVDIIEQMKAGRFLLVDGGEGSCNAVHVDNVVDLAIVCGYDQRATGESFLVTDGERLSWREFWGNYARMLKMDIEAFSSVPCFETLGRKGKKRVKGLLIGFRDYLTRLIWRAERESPVLAMYTLRALRKVVKGLVAGMEKITPEIDHWDLQAYSSLGSISLEKSKTLLNYTPRITVQQGMADCEIWLRDQNYLKVANK
jgi:nucleoside-diphosphate-sugar epimerase